MLFLGLNSRVYWLAEAKVSGKRAVSIFRAEVHPSAIKMEIACWSETSVHTAI
jgi:hypothetical protein